MSDGRLSAVRDDELVRKDAVLAEDLLDDELEAFARECLPVDDEVPVLRLGGPEQFA